MDFYTLRDYISLFTPHLWYLVLAFIVFDLIHRVAVSAQEASGWWEKPFPSDKSFLGWDFWHVMKNISYFATRISAICGLNAFVLGLVLNKPLLWKYVLGYSLLAVILGFLIHPHRLLLNFWKKE